MWEFIIILFFSKTLLLTPDFIDINKGENYFIELKEPISAITTGASIQIDVTKMVSIDGQKVDISMTRRAVSEMFPRGSIETVLIAGNKRVNLTYQGNTLISNDSVRLVLSGNEVPTGVDFSTLVITTNVKLERVKIFWKNYKK